MIYKLTKQIYTYQELVEIFRNEFYEEHLDDADSCDYEAERFEEYLELKDKNGNTYYISYDDLESSHEIEVK